MSDIGDFQDTMDSAGWESASDDAIDRRFFVRAESVSAVRRALFRAPGGAAVVGRYDRETIECVHTMDVRSLHRHWPIIVSRLSRAGLAVVPRPS